MQPETSPNVRLRQARRAAALAAAIPLAVVGVTGIALTWRSYPDAGGPPYNLPPSARWSRHLAGWHEISMLVVVPMLVIWCVLTFLDRSTRRRPFVVVASTAMSLALLALTARAWHQVQWGQLGLWGVTIGDELSGLWYAAFSNDVRFVMIEGVGEVSQADLARWVVVHLLAPVLALVVLAIGWRASEPPGGPRVPRRSIVAPPDRV